MKATLTFFFTYLLLLVLGILFTQSSSSCHHTVTSSGALNHTIYSSSLHCLCYSIIFSSQQLSLSHVSLCTYILIYRLSPLQDVSSMEAGTFLSYSPLYSPHLNLSGMRYKFYYQQGKILINFELIAHRTQETIVFIN